MMLTESTHASLSNNPSDCDCLPIYSFNPNTSLTTLISDSVLLHGAYVNDDREKFLH